MVLFASCPGERGGAAAGVFAACPGERGGSTAGVFAAYPVCRMVEWSCHIASVRVHWRCDEVSFNSTTEASEVGLW